MLPIFLNDQFLLRVDPSATGEVRKDTPMEIAAREDFAEVLKILAEYTEIPIKAKLMQLNKLMYSDDVEESKEEFQRILCSVPVDLVSTAQCSF